MIGFWYIYKPEDENDRLQSYFWIIGYSSVDGINYSSISSNLKITKYKAESYIGLLKNAFVLQREGNNLKV